MAFYTIGVDFGTLSARAVVVDTKDGRVIASAVSEYAHGVMDKCLPSGKTLPHGAALQHPQDYLDSLTESVKTAVIKSGINPDEIIAIGCDFTSSTILPLAKDGTPLCFLPEFEDEPFAYVKMWKHHPDQRFADEMTALAEKRGEKWLSYCGGRVSTEFSFPKILETAENRFFFTDAVDMYLEAADWIAYVLSGKLHRNLCCAGYKYHYVDGEYPSEEFFTTLDETMKNVVSEKLRGVIVPPGTKVGCLTEKYAEKLGLSVNTVVSSSVIDAHAFIPATGMTDEGKLLLITGTSNGHHTLTRKYCPTKGIFAAAKDGVIPGFYGYEAGQSAVGDMFARFIENCVPADYKNAAEKEGISLHKYLGREAAKLRAGESGLLALDWCNGNRSILSDADLSGLILGLTLNTTPAEIYRALIEATAFGTRVIADRFRESGIVINEILAAGGIAGKDELFMQIYADVLSMPVRFAGGTQGGALGSAIYAAVAAGKEKGGYDDVITASGKMCDVSDKIYYPDTKSGAVYEKLYAEYRRIHDYFGTGENPVMKTLAALRKEEKRNV